MKRTILFLKLQPTGKRMKHVTRKHQAWMHVNKHTWNTHTPHFTLHMHSCKHTCFNLGISGRSTSKVTPNSMRFSRRAELGVGASRAFWASCWKSNTWSSSSCSKNVSKGQLGASPPHGWWFSVTIDLYNIQSWKCTIHEFVFQPDPSLIHYAILCG